MRSDWLEAFLTFSESLNFTHAAQRLHISQPALHVKIKKLSENIGAPLYHKQGRLLVLTPVGKRIQAFAREMQSRTDEFLSHCHTGGATQSVSLGAGEGTFLYLLGPAIEAFRKSTTYSIDLHTTDAAATTQALISGQIQLGVTANAALPQEIEATRFTTVEQVVVLPRQHRLSKRKTLRISDLENEFFILPSRTRPHRIAVEQAFANKSISLHVAVEANGWELILHFVKLGLGISIINSCCHVPSGLSAIPIPELPNITYHLLQRRHAWSFPAVEEFKKTLLKYKDHWQYK